MALPCSPLTVIKLKIAYNITLLNCPVYSPRAHKEMPFRSNLSPRDMKACTQGEEKAVGITNMMIILIITNHRSYLHNN
jgi:uncharacterized MAPEG superfamily protein